MLDIRFIRENVELVKNAVKNKKSIVDIDALLRLDTERRSLQQSIDDLKKRRREVAKRGIAGGDSADTIQEGKQIKQELAEYEGKFKAIDRDFTSLLERVPNIPSSDTPIGFDGSADQELRVVGNLRSFDFTPKEHWELGQALGLIDNEQAAKVAGSRFTYLKGELALLELALVTFAFTILTNEKTLKNILEASGSTLSYHPFIPVIPPVFIKPDIMRRMARLEPKEERYYIPTDDLYLVGSAEHTLGPLHLDETLPEKQLPVRYVGFSPAFRREAGSYGKDVKGIIRLHQFDKVEMESFTLPEESQKEQDFFVAIQEHLMQALVIPYRVVLICTGEMGDPDARHIDIEAWMPGQDRYRETHTVDLMTDYQARRLRTKVRRADGTTPFVHTVDGTALAIGRTIAAIMENHQQADGSIAVPEVLHPYLPFKTITAR